MKILVNGGAGYIGSHMTKLLLDRGDEVVVADSLENGHKEAVDARATLLTGNLLDKAFVESIFREHHFDGVIHFAAYIQAGESMSDPHKYFENNVLATLHVVDQLRKHDMNNFIFSSTAAVYGNPEQIPIPEIHPKKPVNTYGESKLMVEKILSWYKELKDLHYVALRYFNASGASLDGSLGERHNPESHIIPKAIEAALKETEFKLFGDDYKTPDGTCVRDYIHVLDLCNAHILALEKLQKDGGGHIYNVGTGKGYSNKEVIDMVKKVSGKDFPVAVMPRRPGDPDELVADASKIKGELGFSPQYSDLETIVKTAWQWHSQHSSYNE